MVKVNLTIINIACMHYPYKDIHTHITHTYTHVRPHTITQTHSRYYKNAIIANEAVQ